MKQPRIVVMETMEKKKVVRKAMEATARTMSDETILLIVRCFASLVGRWSSVNFWVSRSTFEF